MARLTRDVRVLSLGLNRRAGQSIGVSEVPHDVMQQWVREGIVEDVETEEATPTGAEGSVTEEADPSVEELREELKRLGVRGWHLYKDPDSMKEAIRDAKES